MKYSIACTMQEGTGEMHSWSREVQVWACTEPYISSEFYYDTEQEALDDIPNVPKSGVLEGSIRIIEIE